MATAAAAACRPAPCRRPSARLVSKSAGCAADPPTTVLVNTLQHCTKIPHCDAVNGSELRCGHLIHSSSCVHAIDPFPCAAVDHVVHGANRVGGWTPAVLPRTGPRCGYPAALSCIPGPV